MRNLETQINTKTNPTEKLQLQHRVHLTQAALAEKQLEMLNLEKEWAPAMIHLANIGSPEQLIGRSTLQNARDALKQHPSQKLALQRTIKENKLNALKAERDYNTQSEDWTEEKSRDYAQKIETTVQEIERVNLELLESFKHMPPAELKPWVKPTAYTLLLATLDGMHVLPGIRLKTMKPIIRSIKPPNTTLHHKRIAKVDVKKRKQHYTLARIAIATPHPTIDWLN